MKTRLNILAGVIIGALTLAGVFLLFGTDVSVAFAAEGALQANEFFGGPGSTGSSFANAIGLASGVGLVEMVARVIRILLGFLGIIAVAFIIYGGFLYMTSAGESGKIDTAKSIIKNALIGLAVVLLSFIIVHFLIRTFTSVIGDGSGGGDGPGCVNCNFVPPGGKGGFYLSNVNTQCASVLRNFELQMIFTQSVKPETVSRAIHVRQNGVDVQGVTQSDGKMVTFHPSSTCPVPNQDKFCFDSDASYTLSVDQNILKSSSNKDLKCTVEYPCSFSFQTGVGVDTTAPSLTMSAPDPTNDANVYVGVNELLQARAQDDTGVSNVNFYVIDDRSTLFVAGLDQSSAGTIVGNNQPNFFSSDPLIEWDTSGYVPNIEYELWAGARDCAGNTATAGRISVTMRASSCTNEVQDNGETDVDCGGDPDADGYCGACDTDQCQNDNECASGQCGDGVCVANTYIKTVSPGDGATGNLVTITGKGFGALAGTVTFLGGQPAQSVQTDAYQCAQSTQWSNAEIVVQVPQDATDGPIKITTAGQDPKFDATNDDDGPFVSDFDVNSITRPGICALDPTSSVAVQPVVAEGLNFGEQRGTSTFYFDQYEAVEYTQDGWTNTSARVTVPNVEAGNYQTQIFTGGFFCKQANGELTDRACASNTDCRQVQGEACATSWCSQTLVDCSSDADCGEQGGRCVLRRVGSNPRSFTVVDQNIETPPTISYVDTGWTACQGGDNNGRHCADATDCPGENASCDPASNWGPVGQYITVFGSDLGSQVGFVEFLNEENEWIANGAVDFPDHCPSDTWNDTFVTVKIPPTYLNEINDQPIAIVHGAHKLRVKRADGQVSNLVDVVVRNDFPGPAVCSIEPTAGPVGTRVLVSGENFGEQRGEAFFHDQQSAIFGVWSQTSVTNVTVPPLSQTGPMTLVSQVGYVSNSQNFTVGDCRVDVSLVGIGQECCADGTVHALGQCQEPPPESFVAYRISTGPIPRAPQVLVRCDRDVASPVPSLVFSNVESICVNAAVSASFGVPNEQGVLALANMDQGSLVSGTLVEKCTDEEGILDACDSWEAILGSAITDVSSISWTPNGGFEAGAVYRVTLQGGGQAGDIKTAGDPFAYLEKDFSWVFQTSANQNICEVGSVNVSPAVFTATQDVQEGYAYTTKLYANGDNCVELSCQGSLYQLAWESSQPANAVLDQEEVNIGECANTVFARQQTPPNDPARIQVEVANINPAGEHPGDEGLLTIDFIDPKIKTYAPNCQTACVNTQPSAIFNTTMNPATFNQQSVLLYKCQDSLCHPTEVEQVEFAINPTYGIDDKKLNIVYDASLTPNSYYRVLLVGSQITSSSGSSLSVGGSNAGTQQNLFYPGDFSWTFKTKQDGTICEIDHVSVNPKNAKKSVIGDRQAFTATAYGAPDDCSVSGQALQAGTWNWNAWNALDTPNTATPQTDPPGTDQDVAFLLSNGQISLASGIPNYCSASCLNIGSSVTSADPVCGDNVLDYNRDGANDAEYLDYNASSTARPVWLTETCLATGTSACTPENQQNCCGNGVLDLGETCDGGAGNDEDFCSASCLNKGSSSIGSECGDGVVDHIQNVGGEDCDDGNTRNNDGCSSICLFEGAIAISNVTSVCGNGQVETGEDCDDGGFVAGDGCSSSCLNEGTNACALEDVLGCCGNGQVETGEDCDDGNTRSGDSCSSECLFEGSSINTTIPTYCGDGVTDYNQNGLSNGEECDALSDAQKRITGYAVAQVFENAVREVSAQTGLAVSTVTASAGAQNKQGSATLSLECSCQSDSACGDVGTLGCGAQKCCYERSQVEAFYPTNANPDGEGVCRNTSMWVRFNQPMDPASFLAMDRDGDGVLQGQEVQANIALLLVAKKIEGRLVPVTSDNNLCPQTYLQTAMASAPSNLFARAWQWITSMFPWVADSASAAPPYACIVPTEHISSVEQNSHTVSLSVSTLLEPEAVYKLVVLGDDNLLDSNSTGVLSASGVGLSAAENTRSFYVGTAVCTLDEVQVRDTGIPSNQRASYESPSQNFFTKKDEAHVFEAQTLTRAEDESLQEIQPVVNVYDWNWVWGSNITDDDASKDVVSLQDVNNAERIRVRSYVASGNNGQETVTASVRIIRDALNNPPADQLPTVSGSTDVFALMCENPWPAKPLNSAWQPFKENVNQTNFSLFYCRDAGDAGTDDDLPALVSPPTYTQAGGFIQEMLFRVEGTKDAIGVRVLQNPKYLSPAEWFTEQGFIGSASETQLDGYSAVTTGNTIYVAAANRAHLQSGEDWVHRLFSNIYAISFNPDAGSDAQEVFSRVLENFRFNSNTVAVPNPRLCKAGSGFVSRGNTFFECSWDGECIDYCDANGFCSVSGAGCQTSADCPLAHSVRATCQADKDKITRDLNRLISLRQTARALSDYGQDHGRCSVSKEQACSKDEHCPGTEACVKTFPTISEGTFIPSMTVSTWDSWNAELGNVLSTALPVDPLNAFYNNCQIAGYENETCWNANQNTFQCPNRSQVFTYRSLGQERAELIAGLEFSDRAWYSPIDPKVCADGQTICMDDSDCVGITNANGNAVCGENPARDKIDVKVEFHDGNAKAPQGQLQDGFLRNNSFCDDQTTWGARGLCGDGVISGDEVCEIGQVNAIACAVNVDGAEKSGNINVTCNSDCSGFQDVDEAQGAGAVCVQTGCGNGIKEVGEVCDDGVLNGTYGHCGNDCTYSTQNGNAFTCGDGYLGGPEQCDCGTVQTHDGVKNQNGTWANLNQNAVCRVANGQYGRFNNTNFTSCSFDCALSGPSCGDRQVNGPEQCDGSIEIWSGKLCNNQNRTSCVTDNDCPGDSVCGQVEANLDCAPTDEGYATARTRSCSNECTFANWTACQQVGAQFCGNGVVDGNEQCDDGNLSNSDACTNTCELNVCGDGHVNRGVEACDNSVRNGQVCSAPYNDQCNYCTNECQYKTRSGAYCGDGQINGAEFCDGAVMPLTCVQVENNVATQVLGSCQPSANANSRCGTDNSGVCKSAGYCNGGEQNARLCLNDAFCGDDIECETSVCGTDCSVACPFDQKIAKLLVQSEFEGARPADSVRLFSYNNEEGNTPDNAFLHVPACRVGSKLTANIDRSNVTDPDMDIVFITDLSTSMRTALSNSTRIEVAKSSTISAIESLFEGYEGTGATLRIGLVSFGGAGYVKSAHIDSGDDTDEDGEPDQNILLGQNNQALLKGIVRAYNPPNSGGTAIGAGVTKAIQILDEHSEAEVKIVILLSDGAPYWSLVNKNGVQGDPYECSTPVSWPNNQTTVYPVPEEAQTDEGTPKRYIQASACTAEVRYDLMAQNPDILFYSAALTTSESLRALMEHMSSESCLGGTETTIDDRTRYPLNVLSDCEQGTYAFAGDTADNVAAMYQSIVSSVFSTNVAFTTQNRENQTQTTRGAVYIGNNTTLPFPEAFYCRPEPFTIPIRTTFTGEGTVNFSNFTFTYCPIQ